MHTGCVGYCRTCFEQLELLLVAVAESADSQQAARVILNPSGAGDKQSAVKINKNMKGFFVCQSEDDAKRVQYYGDEGELSESTALAADD